MHHLHPNDAIIVGKNPLTLPRHKFMQLYMMARMYACGSVRQRLTPLQSIPVWPSLSESRFILVLMMVRSSSLINLDSVGRDGRQKKMQTARQNDGRPYMCMVSAAYLHEVTFANLDHEQDSPCRYSGSNVRNTISNMKNR